MYLLLNTITKPSTIVLFNEGRIMARESFDIAGREHDELLERIAAFLAGEKLFINELQWIVVVCGPGGFTSTRIISLIVNTWRSLYKIPTQSLTLFEVFELAGGQYPMCVKANRGEYLVQKTGDSTPSMYPIVDMPEGTYVGIGEISDFENRKISIQSDLDYDKIINNFVFKAEDKNIEPYYIKKPNIT